jgi:hypothetical protein
VVTGKVDSMSLRLCCVVDDVYSEVSLQVGCPMKEGV